VFTGFKQSFEKFCADKKKKYDFDDIDQDFYDDFIQFFYDKRCSANYVGRLIKNLKTIMQAAEDEKLHTNTATKLKAFKSISQPVDKIYLSEDEIKKLFDLDLSDNKEWELSRDIFLIGCYSGQRFSDYSRICKDDIKDYGSKKIIELVQKKTNQKVHIPVRPELDFILRKYDYTVPKSYDQLLNRHIKLIAEKAGIKEAIFVKSYPGGLETTVKTPKWKLVCSHTARRSFCTNAYLSGIKIIDIMKISGHHKPDEFLKYVRVDSLDTALSLWDTAFFRGNLLKIVK
jgi:integrase